MECIPSLQAGEVLYLLQSDMHEERQMALMILVEQFRKGDIKTKETIYNLYLDCVKYVNNWDLIDGSAPTIVGGYLDGKPKKILTKLARSNSLWERRIAILATFYFINQGHAEETFKIATLLLGDKHDLIHKAAGWMLREIGKRCGQEIEETFLKKYASVMPRTMLRYAIERFPEDKKRQYMAKKT